MLKVKDVSYKYKNGEKVLENINLDVEKRRSNYYNWKKRFWEINTCKTYCWNNNAKRRTNNCR